MCIVEGVMHWSPTPGDANSSDITGIAHKRFSLRNVRKLLPKRTMGKEFEESFGRWLNMYLWCHWVNVRSLCQGRKLSVAVMPWGYEAAPKFVFNLGCHRLTHIFPLLNPAACYTAFPFLDIIASFISRLWASLKATELETTWLGGHSPLGSYPGLTETTGRCSSRAHRHHVHFECSVFSTRMPSLLSCSCNRKWWILRLERVATSVQHLAPCLVQH